MRTLLLALALLAAALAGAVAEAASPVNVDPVSKLAIRGYDPVAYFTDGAAVPGVEAHALTWEGAEWRFASAGHRDQFAADPGRFAPQYGGWCAWAMTRGDRAPVDPQAWRIVDGRLYLNYSLGIRKKWEADIPGNIAKADEQWAVLGGASDQGASPDGEVPGSG